DLLRCAGEGDVETGRVGHRGPESVPQHLPDGVLASFAVQLTRATFTQTAAPARSGAAVAVSSTPSRVGPAIAAGVASRAPEEDRIDPAKPQRFRCPRYRSDL